MNRAFSMYTGAALLSRSIMKIVNSAKEAVQEIKTLDDTFSKLQMVSGASVQQIEKLKSSYLDLGKELTTSLDDIGKMSEAWTRTGLDPLDSATMQKYLEATTIFEKTASISAENAQSYLVSAMRGFDMTADQLLHIIDVYESLDEHAAVSSSEIASSLAKVASAASGAGIEFETLAS